MIFISVRSASPYRITIVTDVTPDFVAGDYVLTRQDGASTNATVNYAFATDPNTVELAIGGDGLLTGVIYVIALPGQPGTPSATIAYRQPLIQNQVPVTPAEDPEAEAFGIDMDWLADAMTSSGDIPVIRGRQCLVNDLAIIALISRGELFHRPDAGAGLKLNVNGPMTDRNVGQVIGIVTREWAKDSRVQRNGVTVKASVSATTGRLTLFGTILPVAIEDPLIVKLPGGGT